MKFKCKKGYKDLMVKDTWYELEYDGRFNSYMLIFSNCKLEFREDAYLYDFFYTIQELRKQKINKLLNEK